MIFFERSVWELTEKTCSNLLHSPPDHCGKVLWETHSGSVDEELLLLRYDLLVYAERVRQRLPPPPLPDYLRPGREEWGALAALYRETER